MEEIENNQTGISHKEKQIKNDDLSYDLRIRIFQNQKVFGPGMATILQYIEETGSIKQACNLMEMSYSKGWKMINNSETCMKIKLLERKKGGADKGGCVLTEEGKHFLDSYKKLVEEANASIGLLFDKYFEEYKSEKKELL